MAAAGWFIVVCGGGSLALDVTALVLAVLAEECVPGVIQFTLEDPHQRLCMLLLLLAVPVGALLLLVESCWLKYEQQQQPPPPPADVTLLVVLIVLQWLITFVAVGAASSALIVDLVATPVCASYQLAADGTACAGGALAAASAVGLLWVLWSRLHHAQAPPQAQA
ncbi:uncharacterized protein LOC119360759 [Triticum dicoccoides]|uniref:uncharacterized protein LOC119343893 n=1 Tax=Triticum dicoccoides TaxID=85692 RepID=UPI00188E98A5|nr:uncharacterized protein LOC119343893 [Triticum dicoccoides]XP_037471431.1 uncharacterized protein LOC119345472 [Triticum dicoccoides]XP_037472137.1 uncharacterized protein LOC119347646 [Triticum dicoccoides]XP_037482163.1 uncharacterized protein LOC119360759 [Triticum dicoccoides]